MSSGSPGIHTHVVSAALIGVLETALLGKMFH